MVAEVMKHGQSSFEQFGEKVTELFLRNGSPSNPISGFNTKFPGKLYGRTESEVKILC